MQLGAYKEPGEIVSSYILIILLFPNTGSKEGSSTQQQFRGGSPPIGMHLPLQSRFAWAQSLVEACNVIVHMQGSCGTLVLTIRDLARTILSERL